MNEYDRIRVLWADHLGIARGKYLPARLAERGTMHCVTTFALGYDRSMIPAPGSYLLEGLKDAHSGFDPSDVRPSWEDDRTGVVVGHLTMDGEPYPYAARHALQKAAADWAAFGLHAKVGIELEAYVMEPDGDGGWRRWNSPRAVVYGTGRTTDPDGLIDEITRRAEASGFPIESINGEFDPGQFEMTLEYGDAVATADDIFLFRLLAREVALERGFDLTFLGRPFQDVGGSGLHVNFSLVDDDGRNVLADDGASHGLSPLAYQCLAGLVAHHQALVALCAPTVNAYRRLQPGELCGYWANWGYEHRMAGNRIPDARGPGTRIENRVSDGSANVYTAIAAVLQAARLGVADNLDCPEPLTTDGMDEVNTDVGAAPSLAVALEHLAADTAFVDAVGSDLCANFIANKEAEWERYIEAVGEDKGGMEVTDWEIDQYLMFH